MKPGPCAIGPLDEFELLRDKKKALSERGDSRNVRHNLGNGSRPSCIRIEASAFFSAAPTRCRH